MTPASTIAASVALSVAISAAVTQYIDWQHGQERFRLCHEALVNKISTGTPTENNDSIAWMANVCGAFQIKRMP